ncbi:MAG: YqaJ viral recombinase family protein [Homoserinimonas sp.]
MLVEHSVLVELEQRAGASDKDRAAWMAERDGGVTATNIRDLYMGKISMTELAAQKLGIRPNTFTGNQYTAWGVKREPIIAAWVEQRLGIRDEHRVFRAADNPRFLASPDGVGVGFNGDLLVAEIKTGKDDLHPHGEAFRLKGYWIQMLWSMRVTGARRCLYAWEQHDSDWQDRGGQFLEPAPMQSEPLFAWIEYRADIAAELDKLALEFLAVLDETRAAVEAGEEPVIDEDLDTDAVNYLRGLALEKEGAELKTSAFASIKARLAGHATFQQVSSLARVTWTRGGTDTVAGSVVDEEAARAADPKVFEVLAKAETAAERASARLVKAQKAVEVVLAETAKPGLVKKTVRENLTVRPVKETKK